MKESETMASLDPRPTTEFKKEKLAMTTMYRVKSKMYVLFEGVMNEREKKGVVTTRW
jgi:hypothetical protein